MVQFADSQFQTMHEDSRLDTRPVIVDVTGKSSEIETTVDPFITYGKVKLGHGCLEQPLAWLKLESFKMKASFLIRMTSYILGLDTFNRGLGVRKMVDQLGKQGKWPHSFRPNFRVTLESTSSPASSSVTCGARF